jgi:phenylpyruvate tautomerase PptA (4-oxalocrotonate tautomerase family)
MPLLKIHTSRSLPEAEAQALLTSLSAEVAGLLGKPESYVMTCLVREAQLTFGGSSEASCLVELANIGTLRASDTERLSAALCQRLASDLSLPSARIYIRFIDVERHMWGHDGHTFG